MSVLSTPALASEAPAALWEDFLDIYYAPGEVFDRRREGRYGLVLVTLMVAMALLSYAMQSALSSAFDADFLRGMQMMAERGQAMPPEAVEQARSMAGIFGTLGLAVMLPLSVFATGTLLWAVGKAVGSTATLAPLVMVATYAQFPRLLQQVTAIVQGLLLDTASIPSVHSVSLSPARFLDPDATSQVVLLLAGRVELFTLWATVLLAVGVRVVGRVSWGSAVVVAGTAWVAGALPMLAGALR